MEIALIIWYIAMFTNLLVMYFQYLKIWKTKSVKDISTLSQIVWLLTAAMWLIYAISINRMPNIILSWISISYTIYILYYKYRTKCLFEF